VADRHRAHCCGTQLERRLLAGTAHELTTAETIDRLDQTAFELVTLDLPGDMFSSASGR
jgi:hypothetical protein